MDCDLKRPTQRGESARCFHVARARRGISGRMVVKQYDTPGTIGEYRGEKVAIFEGDQAVPAVATERTDIAPTGIVQRVDQCLFARPSEQGDRLDQDGNTATEVKAGENPRDFARAFRRWKFKVPIDSRMNKSNVGPLFIAE